MSHESYQFLLNFWQFCISVVEIVVAIAVEIALFIFVAVVVMVAVENLRFVEKEDACDKGVVNFVNCDKKVDGCDERISKGVNKRVTQEVDIYGKIWDDYLLYW
ncbi:hypothetical protein Glove_648g8 [Diversispora epigaea]|uniref:Transmembrane protein n=1 Tax=Diversispora epigaea TaxID=1348612 RepID=A0A397GA53_9GLOM|nr:hypothetical protein Glove_648g8 [Diversispora epigaea]